jgi:hypothetical protein
MANLSPALLYLGSTTGSNVYTTSSGPGDYSIIKNINICNVTASPASCNVHVLLSGVSSAANNNAILSSFTVAPNETVTYSGIVVMPSNSKIYISQASSSLTFSISGVEYAE